MTAVSLDPRLDHDCFTLGTLNGLCLLLMNNKKVPWFILVPPTQKTELYELEAPLQEAVHKAVCTLSRLTKESLGAEKLNVAAIGNVVSQLHIHVVGRFASDYCWPAPVWGAPGAEPYTDTEAQELINTLKTQLGDDFLWA
ncbi:HIT family protein [Desulfoluna butyratoxydans]|uniref:Histidine triad (Hit) protein n=1 Tax=Desulfoluna butyratoxydans TaxID=231438 RepID=A0A4U8YJ53_9BACT|nr:HIT family protein [Desulfoluna butyratoxydans]VFQ43746.1 histidine triad (hit) protein [Desulfoluna butyratoxydans]